MFPSLCAFFVLILIIVIAFFTVWRKDIQMNDSATSAQLNSVAALTSAQHLNALNSLSTYATPATTLHHQSTGSSNNTCTHFDDQLRDQQQHNCINGDDHMLTEACFMSANGNSIPNGCGNVNCSSNCNNYTFAPVYGQSTLNTLHDQQTCSSQISDQFKELANCNTLGNLNTMNTLNQTMNTLGKDCHLHMPTPYATNPLDYDCVLKQTNSISNQLTSNLATNNSICAQHTYTVQPITTNNLNQQNANQMPAPNFAFERYNNCPTNGTNGTNSEHTYDIPVPKLTPKWV